jgi:hypothetical protein
MGEQSILALILAGIAVGGTLAGALLGSRLQQSTEDRAWRRQHRLDAYADLGATCDAVMVQVARVRVQGGGGASTDEKELLFQKTVAMYQAAERTRLLGSDEIQEPAGNLATRCGTIATTAVGPSLSDDVWDGYTSDYGRSFAAFRALARKEVGQAGG